MIALVDCNNFYASCERVFRPDLAHKPIAVLSNNDGCIIARSQEVKALGIPMGAPLFKYRAELDKQGVSVFSANFSLYGDLSNRVMSVLKQHCPFIEIYSIDEAFLDLSLIPQEQRGDYCRALRATVLRWVGIPVSIGVGPTKTLAKLANHVAKKHPNSQGVWLLTGTEKNRLSSLPISEVWGIGRQLQKRLNQVGIHDYWQLSSMDKALARKMGSVNLERTIRELNGSPCIAMEMTTEPRQRILVSRSFGKDVSSYSDLEAALTTYATRAGEKLRQQKSLTASMYVFIQTNKHKDKNGQYKGHAKIQFQPYTNAPLQLTRAAAEGLRQIYKEGYQYKRGGVMLEELMPANMAQYCLFNESNSDRKLGSIMDAINQKMGGQTLQVAASLQGEKWRMNQNHRSPRYTTRWHELAKVS